MENFQHWMQPLPRGLLVYISSYRDLVVVPPSPFLGSPLPSPVLDLREFFIILVPVAMAAAAVDGDAAPPDPPNLPSSERETVRFTRFAFRIIRLQKSKVFIGTVEISLNISM